MFEMNNTEERSTPDLRGGERKDSNVNYLREPELKTREEE